MKLSKHYRRRYRQIFHRLQVRFPALAHESSVPSYLHVNRLAAWLFWQRLEAALALAGELCGQRVLDLGCGTGVLFKHLHEQGCAITGCDPGSLSLAEFTAGELGIKVSLTDDLALLSSASFDTIFALDVLEHLDTLEPMIDQLHRLCRPHTRLIVSGPTENLLYRLGRRIAGFSGDYHQHEVYGVEAALAARFERLELRRLFWPMTLFRVSLWRPRAAESSGEGSHG